VVAVRIIVSNVRRKNMNQPRVNMLRNGNKKRQVVTKIPFSGFRLIQNYVLVAKLKLRKTKVAII